MTLFTDNPFEKMMIQKPDYGKREKSPPYLGQRRKKTDFLQEAAISFLGA